MNKTNVEIHNSVREHYANLARSQNSCCGDSCGCANDIYTPDLITDIPEDVTGFTLGCGDTITLAKLQPGETVLDLGSGGGLDCFLAARQVGETGRVIGVDMTPAMLERARASALRLGIGNTEFRQGYIEDLPIADASVDVIISNCVINLSPDKPRVISEIYRVLKTGGRLAVSDTVTNRELPEQIRNDMQSWNQCGSGALTVDQYAEILLSSGFDGVHIAPKGSPTEIGADMPEGLIFSAEITARKP
jgi:SAM-dependent methyltransferase